MRTHSARFPREWNSLIESSEGSSVLSNETKLKKQLDGYRVSIQNTTERQAGQKDEYLNYFYGHSTFCQAGLPLYTRIPW